ncbi:hypothetical protein N7533_012493 [Penicillium manginii]|uniref:uncharacterized protein n=1 Tax=Penicillium manginii TaxID=203109 RepID=UPI002546F587|nr:uncharacterized protein N7533_012493 [Penicillium manginii]KAJ5739709.1 hypothetical protein N7533_012493 [Penicillium manginii]
MLDLGAYDSSSEEEDTQAPLQSKQTTTQQPIAPAQIDQTDKAQLSELNAQKQEQQPIPESKSPSGPVLGPASGPAPPPLDSAQLPNNQPSGPSSPYSTSRALVQDLTLPPVPNMDIPPSPPGSPNPAANAKFEHFLSLKKQGVHFNSKLASSSSLKNPSLLKKMMEHAGINEQSQYNTSLSTELWDPSSLPEWGFKEELLRVQQDARQKLDEKNAAGQRSSVEFVSGSGAK